MKALVKNIRTFWIPFAIVIPASYWLGVAVTVKLGLPVSHAWKILVIVGAGWVLQFFMGITVLKQKSWLYTVGLTCTMVSGMAPLLPALILSELTGHQYPLILGVGVLLSFTMMFKKQQTTVNTYGFAKWLPYSWAASLLVTAVGFAYMFHQFII